MEEKNGTLFKHPIEIDFIAPKFMGKSFGWGVSFPIGVSPKEKAEKELKLGFMVETPTVFIMGDASAEVIRMGAGFLGKSIGTVVILKDTDNEITEIAHILERRNKELSSITEEILLTFEGRHLVKLDDEISLLDKIEKEQERLRTKWWKKYTPKVKNQQHWLCSKKKQYSKKRERSRRQR